MALPDKQTLTDRIREGLDINHLRTMYSLSAYATGGMPEMANVGAQDGGEFPDFPDSELEEMEIGVSRRILNNQFIGMSRVLYANPKPKFPQVREEIGEVRSQFFIERFRGDGAADGEWQNEIERMWQDGDGVGVGMVQVGTTTNADTGKRRVTIRHVKAWRWVYDRHENDPCKARWVAILHYLRPEDARLLYGAKADDCVETLFDTNSRGFKVVKAIEYWDIGIGKEKPCHAVFLRSLGSEPVLKEENAYGCLPIAVYVHQQTNTRRRPTGRIELQMPIHEDINDIERKHRAIHKKHPTDIIHSEALDPDDLRQWKDGDPQVLLRIKDKTIPVDQILHREPSLDIPPGEVERLRSLERELTTASGITDADRGNLNQTQRTATENSLIDARSQVQGSWTKRQTILFYRRLVRVVLVCAGLYDRDPVWVDIQGHQILINDPRQPASYISEFLKDHSRIEIDEDSMDFRDVKAERLQALQLHMQAYGPLLQLGMVDPAWYARRVVEIMGEEDPNKILRPPQPDQSQAQAERANVRELINYKDAPPSIQAQMEIQAGFQPAPEHERYLAPAAMQATQALLMQQAAPQPQQQQAA